METNAQLKRDVGASFSQDCFYGLAERREVGVFVKLPMTWVPSLDEMTGLADI